MGVFLYLFTSWMTIILLAEGHSLSSWEVYKREFGKNYSTVEDDYRSQIFFRNLIAIGDHNDRFEEQLESFKKGINQFTDQTEEERRNRGRNLHLQNQVNDWNLRRNKINQKEKLHHHHHIPRAFNWLDKGAVTPIKDQYYCGSCYAFGAVAALESYYFLKTGHLTNFSEQNFLDCAPYNEGCVGGTPYSCFLYALDYGVMLEQDYKYRQMVNPACKFNSHKSIQPISDFEYLEPRNEQLIAREIATNGPVVVSLDSRHFHDYSEGILDVTEGCGQTDHVVALTGYGTDANGRDFFIAKNSWGAKWGEKGYLRIARDINYCSLAEYPLTGSYF